MNCGAAALLPAVALLLVVWAAPMEAAEFTVNYANADTRRWSCRLCGFRTATAPTGTLAAGVLASTASAMRFGRDTGIVRSGGYADLGVDYRAANDAGVVLELAGRDLGLDSRAAALRVARPRRYGVDVGHREIPRNVARDGRSPFAGAGTLSLPGGWVRAFGTGGMTALAAGSRPVALATARERSDMGAWISPLPGVTVRATYFRERKRGAQESSRDFLYQSVALPEAVDYRVEGADAGLRYNGAAVSMALSYAGRRFGNGENGLAWENPYGGVPRYGRSAGAPDNEANTLAFVARARLGNRTGINATLMRNRSRQDAPFLPYTTNDGIGVPTIGEQGLDAERFSSSATVNLVSRPTRRLRLRVAHAVVGRRDRRRELVLAPVLGDLFATAPVAAGGYDYRREKTDVELRYRLPGRWRVSAGFRDEDRRRSDLEIADNDGHQGWLAVNGRIGGGWRGSMRHVRGGRDASEFTAITANSPLTRRYYQARRDDAEWRAGIRFEPAAGGVSMGFDLSRREYDYPDSALGLQSDATQGWAADIAYGGGSAVSVSGFYGAERRESKTAGSVTPAGRNWLYEIEDTVRTAGARLAVKGFPVRAVDLTVRYAHSDGIGDYATSFEAVRVGFPGLVSRHRSVDARLRFAWHRRSAIVVRYRFERYRAADWAIDGVGQDSIRNVLALGRSSADYGNHLVTVSLETAL